MTHLFVHHKSCMYLMTQSGLGLSIHVCIMCETWHVGPCIHVCETWHMHPCYMAHATHCNTLQHTAPHCTTLQHTATRSNTQQHTATHCNTPQHILVIWRMPVCETWFMRPRYMAHSCMWDTTHALMLHASFIRDMTPWCQSYPRSGMWDTTHLFYHLICIHMTWLIYDMTHSYMFDATHSYMYDMTHQYIYEMTHSCIYEMTHLYMYDMTPSFYHLICIHMTRIIFSITYKLGGFTIYKWDEYKWVAYLKKNVFCVSYVIRDSFILDEYT